MKGGRDGGEVFVLLNQSSLTASDAAAAFLGGPGGEDRVDTRRVAFLTVREVLQLCI